MTGPRGASSLFVDDRPTPALQLRTLYVLDEQGRLTSTREPGSRMPPAFALVRGDGACAWAVRSDVPADVADELNRLARQEPTDADLRDEPVHAVRYIELVGGRVESGPAFAFPELIAEPPNVVLVDDPRMLQRHLGDLAGELDGRAPMIAALAAGHAVSVCHCARRSEEAAEAGLYTAKNYRGRGLGPQVAAAWALAIRASGRTPLYSTSWDNDASLAVARKLGLVMYASDWSLAN